MRYEKLVAFRVPQSQHAQLKKMAKAKFTSMGTIIRQCLAKEMKQVIKDTGKR